MRLGNAVYLLIPSTKPPSRVYSSNLRRHFLSHFRFSSSSVAVMPGSEPSEIQWPARRVRDTYFDFFKGKGHKFWPSSPVVPHNDPTLLFANAGTKLRSPILDCFSWSICGIQILLNQVNIVSDTDCGVEWSGFFIVFEALGVYSLLIVS